MIRVRPFRRSSRSITGCAPRPGVSNRRYRPVGDTAPAVAQRTRHHPEHTAVTEPDVVVNQERNTGDKMPGYEPKHIAQRRPGHAGTSAEPDDHEDPATPAHNARTAEVSQTPSRGYPQPTDATLTPCGAVLLSMHFDSGRPSRAAGAQCRGPLHSSARAPEANRRKWRRRDDRSVRVPLVSLPISDRRRSRAEAKSRFGHCIRP